MTFLVPVFCFSFASSSFAEQRLFSRSFLWNAVPTQMVDTSQYKKKPPYKIGFSNASVSNSWRVLLVKELQAEAAKHKDLISNLYVTDAQDKPDKQISDTEDLITKGIDLLIISAATEAALDPIVQRIYKQGIPVVCVDRRVKSDSFVSFVSSSMVTEGRLQMTWLCEMLHGKGNVVMLGGVAGAAASEEAVTGAREALSQFPEIKVLATEYTNYSPAEGKRIMSALIQSYGKKIDGVWGNGLQNSGAIEALEEAKIKVPITGDGHLNAFQLKVQKYGYPAMSVGFSPKIGAEAVDIALKVLQGLPVPHVCDSKTRTLTATQNTVDIQSDGPWAVQPELPGDAIVE